MHEKRITVLIIEDEQVFRTLALQVFDGCDKLSAASAADGLAKFKEFCPDITLLDIGLPDKNGLDLLPELISYDPEAFVVMLTLSRVSSDVKLSKERGAAGYIIKPFTYQKVWECVAKYKAYKKTLQSMTPVERASKLVENLKIEALHDDLNNQLEETIKEAEDNKHETSVETLLKSWNILFADDFLINRERAKIQLSKLGCNVDLSENGNDVLNKTRYKHYHVLLIDSKMGEFNGYDVAKEIRRNEFEKGTTDKSLLIIMVENADELDRRMWQKAGMNDFIKKPASFTKIRELIKKHAKRQIDLLNTEYIN